MATYSTPIPGVPQYGQAALAAKTAYGNTLTRLNQQRSSLLRKSGFAGDINAESGVVTNMRVDGSSRYGGLQQLNRSQAMRDDQARWSGIERGLGAGGGLAAQMRNQSRFDFGREDADFAQGLLESLSGFQDEQNSAAYSRDAAMYQAELEAARLAIQQQQFNQANFRDPDPGPAPSAAAPQAAAPRNYPAATPAAQRAAQSALNAAQNKKLTPAEAALAARSAALNKMYGL